MFFHYKQNNTGGNFDVDDKVHVNVIIEADNYLDANLKAESVGIYFDGVNDGIDCDCCGDRWYQQYSDSDADNFPSIYGELLSEYVVSSFVDDGVKAYVYYLDGRMEIVR